MIVINIYEKLYNNDESAINIKDIKRKMSYKFSVSDWLVLAICC